MLNIFISSLNYVAKKQTLFFSGFERSKTGTEIPYVNCNIQACAVPLRQHSGHGATDASAPRPLLREAAGPLWLDIGA